MYSFHITDLVYIIYAYLPYAAYYQAKKSWVNKVFMIEIIFILILINTFTVLDASNNPVLRIVAVCSGSIFSILALRYWYSAKKSFQRKTLHCFQPSSNKTKRKREGWLGCKHDICATVSYQVSPCPRYPDHCTTTAAETYKEDKCAQSQSSSPTSL